MAAQFQPGPAVWDAIELAARAHRGQVRKSTGVPYLVHPLGVARLLIEHGLEEEVVIAGVLHDVVEDTPVTLEELEASFGARVARLVSALSEPDKSAPWEARKRHTLEVLREVPLEVVLASCADKLDNLRALEQDLARLGEALWASFKRGRAEQAWYYRGLAEVFQARHGEHALVRAYVELVPRVFGPG